MRIDRLLIVAGIAISATAACSIPKSDFTASNDGGTSGTDANDALAIVATPNSLDVDEEASKDFTVALNHAPGADVTVQVQTTSDKIGLSLPELTFNDSNFSVPQTIKVSGLKDKDASDENGLVVTLTATGLDTQQVQVSVKDDDHINIVTDVTGTTFSVDEGMSTDVRVHLSAQPAADVSVAAILGIGPVTAEPTSRIFTTLNYDTDQVFTFSAAVDANTINEDVSLAFRATGLTDQLYTVHVVDKDVLNIQVAPGSMTVNEQGTPGQIQVSLTQMPGASVTVDVTTTTGAVMLDKSSVSFTPQNYNVAQFITVTAPADADTADGTDTIHFKASGLAERTVGVTVKDDDVQKIMENAPATLTVAENGTTTFDVWLAFKPQGTTTVNVGSLSNAVATATPGTLTFDPTTYATHQTVTVKGTDDNNLVTNSTSIRLSEATLGNTDIPTNVTDDDTQVIVLSKMMSTITEPNSDTFTAKLGFDPGGTVMLTVTSGDPSLQATPGTLTFNSTNFGNAQTVTMTAVDDADANSLDTTVSVAGGGATTQQVMVHVNDNDVLAIALDQTGTVQINEGGSVTVNVHLTAKPNSSITVTPNFGGGTPISVAPGSVTFTTSNYGNVQALVFSAAQDANTSSESVPVNFHASTGGITDVPLTLQTIDDDVLGIKINPTGTMTLTEQGTAGTLAVSLSAMPPSTTTVTLSSSTTDVSLGSTSLMFTTGNWQSPQNVTVSAPDDLNTINGASVITVASAGLTSQTLNVTVIDNDTQAIMNDAPSTITVNEGANTTFHVWMAFQPTGTLTVNLSSLNTAVATVSPSFYTFGPGDYGNHKVVTVTGTQDQNLVTNNTTVRLNESSLGNTDINTSVADDDTQAIVFSKSSLSIAEGGNGTFTVNLAFDPGGTVNVAMSSTNSTALPVSPATIQFTSANYSTPITATVNAPLDSNTVSEAATITGHGASAPDATLAASVTDVTQIVQFGWPTPFSSSTNGDDSTVIAFRIPGGIPTTTTLDSLGMYASSTNGEFKIALYSSNATDDRPGTLIADSGAGTMGRAIVGGNNIVDISPDKVLSSGSYWIALRASAGASIGFLNTTSTSYGCTANMIMSDGWPSNWVGSLGSSTSCSNLNVLNLWITTYHQ